MTSFFCESLVRTAARTGTVLKAYFILFSLLCFGFRFDLVGWLTGEVEGKRRNWLWVSFRLV